MTRLTKILVIILIVGFITNVSLIIYDIRQEIFINQKIMQEKMLMNDQILKYIFKELKEVNNKVDNNYTNLTKEIKSLPEKERIKKLVLEEKLKQVNIMVVNKTLGALGSGVSLKYNGQYYILSAGHMARVTKDKSEEQDQLELWENKTKVCDLEIVKHDFTTHEIEDSTMGMDLILLRPKQKDIVPKYYVELNDFEPVTSTEVYIVGNPTGIEDVVSEGRIAIYINNFMYLRDGCYFGNSGGGVYTVDGKLIGIVSHLNPQSLNPYIPPFMLDGIVRLEIIQKFLKDVK